MPHWERLAVRALGASETVLTVVSRRDVGPAYTRITVRHEGFLARHTPFPTMWLRLWFTSRGKDHQRAFTVVDPRPDEGVFDMEFALLNPQTTLDDVREVLDLIHETALSLTAHDRTGKARA